MFLSTTRLILYVPYIVTLYSGLTIIVVRPSDISDTLVRLEWYACPIYVVQAYHINRTV